LIGHFRIGPSTVKDGPAITVLKGKEKGVGYGVFVLYYESLTTELPRQRSCNAAGRTVMKERWDSGQNNRRSRGGK
jgi:hypothetical protein